MTRQEALTFCALEKSRNAGYSSVVTAKKLMALMLAAGYLLSAVCRFACAETLAARARCDVHEAVTSSAVPACHHHASKPEEQRSRGKAPCCMTDAGAPALVNSGVAAPSPARRLCLGEIAAQPAAIIAAESRAFGPEPSPPLGRSVVLPALSPRAPPFPAVVL